MRSFLQNVNKVKAIVPDGLSIRTVIKAMRVILHPPVGTRRTGLIHIKIESAAPRICGHRPVPEGPHETGLILVPKGFSNLFPLEDKIRTTFLPPYIWDGSEKRGGAGKHLPTPFGCVHHEWDTTFPSPKGRVNAI